RRRPSCRRRRRLGGDQADPRGCDGGRRSGARDPPADAGRAVRRASRRVRVLFLTHRLPYAPNRGDRVRAYHLLRLLSARPEVDLLSLVHDAEEASHAGDLASMAASVTTVAVPRYRNLLRTALFFPTSRPATHTMLDAPDLSSAVATLARRSPDAVLAYCSGM